MSNLKDTSIFEGWLEFESDDGVMRAENKGSKRADVYLQDESGAFVFDRIVKFWGKFTCDNVYKAFSKQEYNRY